MIRAGEWKEAGEEKKKSDLMTDLLIEIELQEKYS